MIRAFLTKKMAKKMPQVIMQYSGEVSDLDKWCVNMFTLELMVRDVDVVVAMCAANCFGFILWDVGEEELSDLPELLKEGIELTLKHYGVREEILKDYLSDVPLLYEGLTRADLGKMNPLCADVSFWCSNRKPKKQIPRELFDPINERYVGSSQKNSYHPKEKMISQLAERYQMQCISCTAFEIKLICTKGEKSITRILQVPCEENFERLHRAIYLVAEGDYSFERHYRFKVGDLLMDSDDEAYDYEYHMGDDYLYEDEEDEEDYYPRTTTLSALLKEGRTFTYVSDGKWKAEGLVVKEISGYDKYYPTCTGGEGGAFGRTFQDEIGELVDLAGGQLVIPVKSMEELLFFKQKLGNSRPDLEEINHRLKYLRF